MTATIAHIFPDSPFLAFTADTFESVAPGRNHFLVFAMKGELDRHALPPTASAEAIAADETGWKRSVEIAQNSDIVIAHSMNAFSARVLLASPLESLRVWSGWGGDYYGSDHSLLSGLLGPQTLRYHRSLTSTVGKFVRLRDRRRASGPLHRAARAADVFSAPIPEDFDVFTSRFPEFDGRYGQLNYASVEDTFMRGSHEVIGDDVLVGNSATLANNHFETLALLANQDLAGRRVIVPLSYGDDPGYADAVSEAGYELIGSAFVPLRDFMPLDEYQSVIAGCSAVVMGHKRQQGIGNIAAAMWRGARVFLDDRNPTTSFVRTRGGVISTLSELAAQGLPTGRAEGSERAANRSMLRAFWGRETVLRNIQSLIDSRDAT